jgi:hypothetical protein
MLDVAGSTPAEDTIAEDTMPAVLGASALCMVS